MSPKRIHRPAVRGWRPPEDAIYVGPGSEYATPFRWRTREALARVPALDGSPWELETRISADGHHHPYKHADGRITSHTSRYMTRRECIDLFRHALTAPTPRLYVWRQGLPRLTVDLVRQELTGRDLACRCALNQLCHADVLLEVANSEADR
ncbi:DUF4326 domain-containing protein [Streptomyces sp. ISL-94]|uniref:DUF4326 domain-containing protein n=1 Tax=Streptomyces sp. ISL-94 TaxID=2819190 RepID=UPI001BE84707|nr:DUF4326 domain-containing protein [Streptomyces sp. ISL-94]MBT2477605.1 DUF4326 domain-containing protein [Streptomyces sp. ISL-94]